MAEPEVVEGEPALIPESDVTDVVPAVPEARVEHERERMADMIEELVREVCEAAETREEGWAIVDRLAEEANCHGRDATLGQLRALKMRLEGELMRMRQ